MYDLEWYTVANRLCCIDNSYLTIVVNLVLRTKPSHSQQQSCNEKDKQTILSPVYIMWQLVMTRVCHTNRIPLSPSIQRFHRRIYNFLRTEGVSQEQITQSLLCISTTCSDDSERSDTKLEAPSFPIEYKILCSTFYAKPCINRFRND